ncbi:MAG: carboxypeptidase-like regulatory domain-containing protein, partial [Flavobacteriales bacterium]|nr:carboxypeptidase-like regulatory domain-containing protein [Flavobacteriales bacterium]
MLSFSTLAQVKSGDKFFENHEYARAISSYLKYYNKQKKTKSDTALSEVIEKLAHAYRLTQDYKNAEIFYSKALKTGKSNPSLAKYYVEILKSNNKLDKTREVFVVYSTNLSKFKNSFDVEISTLEGWMDLEPIYKIEPVQKLNSKYADFSPYPYENGIVFVSERLVDNVYKETYGWTKRPYLSVFYTEGDSTHFGKVKPFSGAINDEYHNGPVVFDTSETIAAFTRVQNLKKGADFVNKPQIYFSTKVKKKWTKAIPFVHNDLNHSFAHPALSADGKTMIFVTDQPGGFGQKDLYITRFENGNWSTPENLGNTLNSSGNEMFPYFRNDSTIYFSSDGFTGFGGLDLFKSTLKNGKWSTPENLKQPINSGKDDFGIMFFTNQTGLISSNRKDRRHSDDIYFFRAIPQKAPINITGLFVYSELEPAAFAAIKLLDEDDNEILTTFTNEKGEFVFEGLAADKNYKIVPVEDLSNLSADAKIFITNEKGADKVELHRTENGNFEYATLSPDKYDPLPILEAVDEPIAFNNILGRVYEKLPGDVPEGLEVVLVDDEGKIAFTAKVDANGNFQFEELPPDANFQIRVKEGIEDVKIVLTNDADEAVAIIEQKDSAFTYEVLKKDEATINLLSVTDIPLQLKETLKAKIDVEGVAPQNIQLILRNKRGEDVSVMSPNTDGT